MTFFDTAEVYGPFRNEELVGEALAPVRDQVVIATKFGMDIGPNGMRMGGTNSKPAQIKAVAEASLRRLRTNRLDLFYAAGSTPQRADRGRRRGGEGPDRRGQGAGLRPFRTWPRHPAPRPRRAAGHRRAERIFDLVKRRPETTILPICEELGIGFVPYSPLGLGFLTGYAIGADFQFVATDMRNNNPRFTAAARAANQALIDHMAEIGGRLGAYAGLVDRASPGCWPRKPWIVPIPQAPPSSPSGGDRRPPPLTLSATPTSRRSTTPPRAAAIQGDRYPDAAEQMTGVEAASL